MIVAYDVAEVSKMYLPRLRDLREDKDMKQKEVAAILGIDQRVYSNYETGKREIPLHHLVALADFYHVTTDYLLGRCASRLSPDVLDEIIIEDRTAGELLQEIQNFSPERKKALNVILNDMHFTTMIGQYNKKKK